MKRALIIAVLAACACCTASERMTAKATPEPIANYLPDTMTEREQAALSEIMPKFSREVSQRNNYAGIVPIPPLEEAYIATIPYYVLDVQAFAANPVMTRLEECARPADDKVHYVVIEEDEIHFNATATREPDGRWVLRETGYSLPQTESYLSRIPKLLAEAGAKDFRLLEVGGLRYAWITRDGSPAIYTPAGLEIPDFERVIANAEVWREWGPLFFDVFREQGRRFNKLRIEGRYTFERADSIARAMLDSLRRVYPDMKVPVIQ
ncbi:MAG: hypothetical protein LBG30_04430 [Odoribacteraceae bacterium]|jgi:hypothetical protein|nr:hypothetical protein [Odoribacteraceae bacterium]